MFSKLTMKLQSSQSIGEAKASAFQGLLFDFIDPDYAAFLHQQRMHPYSQYLLTQNGETQWVVSTLTDEAYEHIIEPLLKSSTCSLDLKQGNIHTDILSKQVKSVTSKELLNQFTYEKTQRRFRIEALTPTAFKRAGNYYLLPEPRLIYQSLMNRYSLLADELEMSDEETLDQISSSTLITGYRMKTVRFPLEGVTLPGFKGSFTIKIKGTETMARYVRMLLRFGEYSGIGIKTGMGMGAVRISTGNDNTGGRGE